MFKKVVQQESVYGANYNCTEFERIVRHLHPPFPIIWITMKIHNRNNE